MTLSFKTDRLLSRPISLRIDQTCKVSAVPTQHFITNKRPYNPRFVDQIDVLIFKVKRLS
jgi:hypothetical protein